MERNIDYKKATEKRMESVSINYDPHYVDLSSFTLAAECVDGELSIFPFEQLEGEHNVYCIQIDEDMYVGSSANLKNRIWSHHNSLCNGKHISKRMQQLYNEKRRFKVYIIMRIQSEQHSRFEMDLAENFVTRLLNPSMNSTMPRGLNAEKEEPIWTCNTLRHRNFKKKQGEEMFSNPKKADVVCPTSGTIVCPYCGQGFMVAAIKKED